MGNQEIETLIEQAKEAGVRFQIFGGGQLLMRHSAGDYKQSAIVAKLRPHRDTVTRILRNQQGDGESMWLEHYHDKFNPLPF